MSLRPVATKDEAAVETGVCDLAVSGWLAVVPHPYSEEDFRYFLTEIAVPGEVFAIEEATCFAGIMSIEDGVLDHWLAPSAQGLGYATEAGQCLVDAHFATTDEPLASGYF